MKEKLLRILKEPVFIAGVCILLFTALMFFIGNRRAGKAPEGDVRSIETRASVITGTIAHISSAPVTSAAKSTSRTTSTETTTTTASSTTTTASTTSETATATEVTTTEPVTEPPAEAPQDSGPVPGDPLSPYLYAGVSPNSSFYQERLAIAGDSIASGYQIYGYIPYEHNLAKESVGLWNLGRYTFNFGYGDMSMVDAVGYMKPRLLMISIGMNDLPMYDPGWFAGLYSDLVSQILAADPDVNIVCAGITPVADYVTYSTNENIRNYNAAVADMVAQMNSPQVFYFDAYSVLADGGTLALSPAYSGGDGIHITSGSYNDLLTALFNFLDTTPVMENILNTEGQ